MASKTTADTVREIFEAIEKRDNVTIKRVPGPGFAHFEVVPKKNPRKDETPSGDGE